MTKLAVFSEIYKIHSLGGNEKNKAKPKSR